MDTEYVICGVSPDTIDNHEKETALFFARKNGRLWFHRDYESSAADVYIRGRYDHAAAFAKLHGGYKIKE